MSTTKPLVLIVGATGNTGREVTKTLLKDGGFRVAILVRAKSTDKPIVQQFKASGADVRPGDIGETPEKIQASLQGVDILISLVSVLIDQKPLLLAAKNAGVGRVVPSDFGPTAPRGVMAMHDIKLDIREYIKTLGIPYTFIEVGWWLQQMFPWPHAQAETLLTPKAYVGDQQKKVLFIALESIPLFVAHIIADPRTVNQTVIAYDGEATTAEAWEIATKLTGEDFSDYYRIPDQFIEQGTLSPNAGTKIMSQYATSLYIRGDNRLENALERGALDARKLYPDIPGVSLEDGAKHFYATLPIPDYDMEELSKLKQDL